MTEQNNEIADASDLHSAEENRAIEETPCVPIPSQPDGPGLHLTTEDNEKSVTPALHTTEENNIIEDTPPVPIPSQADDPALHLTTQDDEKSVLPALHRTEQDNLIEETGSDTISPKVEPVPVPVPLTTEPLPSTVQQIAATLAVLFQPTDRVVELRALFEDATASGYYDDMAKLAADADVVEAAQPQGIYVTLNEPSPALLSRRANRIKMRLGKKDATTADVDIVRRRWFPVDIDAVRPSGVSSTDAEHEAALAKAGRIATYLREEGWPEPVTGDSGNGAHLLYRVDLPNTPESTDLVRKGLEALAFRFDDEESRIDTANHNASRLTEG